MPHKVIDGLGQPRDFQSTDNAGVLTPHVNINGTVPVSIAGTLPVTSNLASNAAITSVNVSTSSIALAAANAARRQLILYNAGTLPVAVALASSATVSAYSFVLGQGETRVVDSYTGPVSAIAGAGTHPVRVTEVTAS